MPRVALRPAGADDRDFAYQVHRAAMHDVVAQVWGWREDDQKTYFVRGWDAPQTQIVVVDGHDAGVLIVENRPDEIYLGRIELDPIAQGHGVGATLIGSLQARGRPVRLEVFVVNTRAQALYRRLGFREVARAGAKLEMVWQP